MPALLDHSRSEFDPGWSSLVGSASFVHSAKTLAHSSAANWNYLERLVLELDSGVLMRSLDTHGQRAAQC